MPESGESTASLLLTVGDEGDGLRLDRAAHLALSSLGDGVPHVSRTRMGALIREGCLLENGSPVLSPSRIARRGECYELLVPPADPEALRPEPLPLHTVYEDEHLIVIDKPAGMVVHPAPGHAEGTLVHALLARGPLSGLGLPWRPGIVHRLDRGTSGLLVAARTDAAHASLSADLAERKVERGYLAIAWGEPARREPRVANLEGVAFERGGWIRVEAAIGAHPSDRLRRAVRPDRGRPAASRLRVLERAGSGDVATASLVQLRLETGRTHQIRVHMAHLGCPLVGDATYGRRRKAPSGALRGPARDALETHPEPALHAASLGFRHPRSGEWMRFERAPPAAFRQLAEMLGFAMPHWRHTSGYAGDVPEPRPARDARSRGS